jgi:hypothetical protein
MAALQARALMILWAIDHLLLALVTLGNCRSYEMISSALYSLELDRKMVGVVFRPLVDLLLRPLGPNHCRNSYEWQQNIYKAGASV